MERNRTEDNRGPRRGAERDAAKPIDGEDPEVDQDGELQEPEEVPSFLTARELQARDPAKGQAGGNEEQGQPEDEKARKRPG